MKILLPFIATTLFSLGVWQENNPLKVGRVFWLFDFNEPMYFLNNPLTVLKGKIGRINKTLVVDFGHSIEINFIHIIFIVLKKTRVAVGR